MSLCVTTEVLIWKLDSEAGYSKFNGDIQLKNLINQVKARVQDLNTIF